MMFDNLFAPAYPEGRRVVVNLIDDTAYRCVVQRRAREYLVLKGVEMIRDRGRPLDLAARIDGEVLVYRERIEVIQVLGEPS